MVDLLVEAERLAIHLEQVAQRTRDLIAQGEQLLATQQLERDAAGERKAPIIDLAGRVALSRPKRGGFDGQEVEGEQG